MNGAYENLFAGYGNRFEYLPAGGGALALPTVFFSDNGAPVANNVTFSVDMSQQINLGAFTNGTGTVQVNGLFNGWGSPAGAPLTWDPNIIVTNQVGVLQVFTTNVFVGTFAITSSPNATITYKFVQNGGAYEGSPVLADSGNRAFQNNTRTLPQVFFSDNPYALLSQVTFSVDMSAQLFYGNWTPADGVFCQGINGNWNNNTVNTMTNDPNAANTNIYYVTYTLGQGSANSYKFTYNGGAGTVYESPISTGGNNRNYTVPLQSTVNVPTVYFSDLSINDLLVSNVLVTFSVNMSNAVEYPLNTPFSPSEAVYVNGPGFTGSWLGWDPVSLAPNQLFAVGSTLIYTNSFVVLRGQSVGITYKYGINDGSGNADNEAASNNNHLRYARLTATGAYTLPLDTFGNQYNEPNMGSLTAAPGPGGTATVSWLGAPNVLLQTSSSVTGPWVSHPETGGAVYTGSSLGSANGSVTVTNWPVSSGNLFYRLIQQ